MSRARRRIHDDLVDVVFDVIRSSGPGPAPDDEAGQRAWAEREAARAAAKADARRERERRAIRSYVGAGAGLLAGGLASIALPTVAAVGVGLLAGGAANFFVRLLQTTDLTRLVPRLPQAQPAQRMSIDPPEVDGKDLPKSQRDVVQGVLDDAADCLQTLQKVSEDIARDDAESAEVCRRLVRAGEKLSDAVAEAPRKLPIAQRALTYYLKEASAAAAKLAVAPQRDTVRHALARIEMYLEKTLLDLHEVDSAAMDLDMRLLNQALDEDLNPGKTP